MLLREAVRALPHRRWAPADSMEERWVRGGTACVLEQDMKWRHRKTLLFGLSTPFICVCQYAIARMRNISAIAVVRVGGGLNAVLFQTSFSAAFFERRGSNALPPGHHRCPAMMVRHRLSSGGLLSPAATRLTVPHIPEPLRGRHGGIAVQRQAHPPSLGQYPGKSPLKMPQHLPSKKKAMTKMPPPSFAQPCLKGNNQPKFKPCMRWDNKG